MTAVQTIQTQHSHPITLSEDQEAAAESFSEFMKSPNEHVMVLEGYAGTGKAQPLDCKVYTPTGPKLIGELVVGDTVLGANGQPTEVLGVYPQGKKPTFRVTFRDGSTTRCCPDHLWTIRSHKGKWSTRTTQEILDAGLRFDSGPHKFRIPLISSAAQFQESTQPFAPYLVGVLLGDGSTAGNGPAFSVGAGDEAILHRVQAELPAGYSVNSRATGPNCAQHYIRWHASTRHTANPLMTWLRGEGLDCKAGGKFIPNTYKYNSVEARWALLRGLMDTDGSCTGNRTTYSTTSPRLVKDIKELVQSLGGTAIEQSTGREGEYRVNIKLQECPFSLPRKAAQWAPSKKNPPSRCITSIEPVDAVEQVCIRVAAQDSLYLTDEFLVTHNTTLTNHLLVRLDKLTQMRKAVNPDVDEPSPVFLTATTNKACEALAESTGRNTSTIQSLLGLVVKKDYVTGKTELVPKRGAEPVEDLTIFIDEASYIGPELLGQIFKMTTNCKLIFIGDPAQLLSVGSRHSPVFNLKVRKASLTKVMRQAEGNPIIQLATDFRNTVNTGKWTPIKPDGKHIIHLSGPDYERALMDEFNRPDWDNGDSRVLAWKNNTVDQYNKYLRNAVKGDPELKGGDYVICNSYIRTENCNLKTDQLVRIHSIKPASNLEFPGYYVVLATGDEAFMPQNREVRKSAIAWAKKNDNALALRIIDTSWIDLRAAFACTVDKSQGSTYNKVFVDLNDIGACYQVNRVARMLYVGVSRARHQVILTGDF